MIRKKRGEMGRWGDGRWKMEDGRWKMEDGRWEMGDGSRGGSLAAASIIVSQKILRSVVARREATK
jgi:hypothetical protein